MFKDKVIKINLLKKYDIDNCKFKITDFKKDFEFELKELYIYLFPKNIGLLTIKLEVDYENFNELYEFNNLFVKIYTQSENDPYISISQKNKNNENCPAQW
jgi:hypothetical protein